MTKSSSIYGIIIASIWCFMNMSCVSKVQTADILITNGQVFLPLGDVQGMDIIINADTITSVEESGQHKWSSENIIDADGNFVMPGLNDAHAHFMGVGQNITRIDLLAMRSWKEILEAVEKRVKHTEPGKWIVGRGWHQEKWTDTPAEGINGFPSHKELSAISPENPVILSHASGHGIIANALAMELAGVDEHTPTPLGGQILKDENGVPIGIFQENAMELIRFVYNSMQEQRTQEEKEATWKEYISLAEEECLKQGITSVQIPGISMAQARSYHELAMNDELSVRLYCMLNEDVLRTEPQESLKIFMDSAADSRYFQCRAVKGYMDGALGSRGAWLLEDYADKPGYRGENVTPLDTLRKSLRIADELGMQMCIHAIGDKANREVLNIYEEVGGHGLKEKRWRIEHAQHLNPVDIPRFNELGVIASMQPIHCTSDAPYVEKRLGKIRAENGAYKWKTLQETGASLAFGTDAPVERINPFENIYAAVTRQSDFMDSPFYPEECVSREDALRIYTAGNAYAEFAEKQKGTLAEGMLADIIIVNKNLLTCPVEEIPHTQVLFTIVGGNIRYMTE